ncbi:hypothetical protein FHS15_001986 [Paenibacillus castaneae]|nr:hypothetical protein [Paenibacillus castaneae]
MRQKSESPANNELYWLQNRYEQRKSRSVELGINAIDKLVKDNKPVSYHTVSELTRELDPDGEGIHSNTFVGIANFRHISLSIKLPSLISRVKGPLSSLWTIWNHSNRSNLIET